MKTRSNTIALEQEEFCKKNHHLSADQAVSDQAADSNEGAEHSWPEGVAYYCDLTGCPIYL